MSYVSSCLTQFLQHEDMITLDVKKTFVIYLLTRTYFLSAFVQAGDTCSSLPPLVSFSKAVINHLLKGFVISTVHVTSDQECQMKCILSKMCDSFNLGPQAAYKLYSCEILDFRSSRITIKRKGWKFRAGWCQTSPCLSGGTCYIVNGQSYFVCAKFWEGSNCGVLPKSSCSEWKASNLSAPSGVYIIAPGYQSGVTPFWVHGNMTDKNAFGVTVVSHDSEIRTTVLAFDEAGSYSRDVHYQNATLLQLANLTAVSSHCEQFVKYECHGSSLAGHGWLVSRDGTRMDYWGGATPGSVNCACGMSKTCYDSTKPCNFNANIEGITLEDSGLLTDKSALPVSQLRFGDTGD